MKRTTKYTSFAVGIALALGLFAMPTPALAAQDVTGAAASEAAPAAPAAVAAPTAPTAPTTQTLKTPKATNALKTLSSLQALVQKVQAAQVGIAAAVDETASQLAETGSATDKLLEYDPAALDAIGTQESTGHTICCPSFSCAYADAVMDGTIHDHDYYTCSNCSWTDWGGGNSWNRNLGSNQALLREAYDQITVGRPTVVHVAASYGEHWIALIGYQNAADPDNLTLDNFIALDPWDGSQIVAGDRFSLYGDFCQHVSER